MQYYLQPHARRGIYSNDFDNFVYGLSVDTNNIFLYKWYVRVETS